MKRITPAFLVATLAFALASAVRLSPADTTNRYPGQSRDVPTFVFVPFEIEVFQLGEWMLAAETSQLVFDGHVSILTDAKACHLYQPGQSAIQKLAIEVRRERVGQNEITLDTSAQCIGDASPIELNVYAGHAETLQPGAYVYSVYVWQSGGSPPWGTIKGWLRLQVWGSIPGDLDLDGDVDLNDFATFAVNYTG